MPYFKFHVAAQTHLSHLITETQKITAKDDFEENSSSSSSSNEPKTLYSYYDGGKEEIWVTEMKERTAKIRSRIY